LFWKLGKKEVYNHGVNRWYVAVKRKLKRKVRKELRQERKEK
jgi:hypothetical protein